MANINTILRDHVSLQLECIDRLYLHGYVPALQRPNQLAYFLNVHKGFPIPSPALLRQMSDRFVASIRAFARRHRIPIVHFDRDERKDDVAKRRLARFHRQEGVVFIGVAQERCSTFRAYKRRDPKDPFIFRFYRGEVMVNHYYFYVLDRDWGPGFIKFASYAPFGVRLCLNGHEWLKRQLTRRGIPFQPLDNGFRSCSDPRLLQRLADQLGPHDVERFFRRWLAKLPHPFSPADRAANYRYWLSVRQMEFSLTQVFDRPVAGRQLFEELIRDNLDLGRPDRIQLLFNRRVHLAGRHPTPGSFRTRVVHSGVIPKLSLEYKSSRVKQYFKLDRALRTETVINDPYDVGVGRRLSNLPYLRTIARNINHRLLATERTSHNCIIAPPTFESLHAPAQKDGQHVPALRFGDPRVMALLAALCLHLPTPNGFTNQALRSYVAHFRRQFASHSADYTRAQMTYDLRRLRLRGLIDRIPKKNRYLPTSLGRRVAFFFTKTYSRILRPALARTGPSPTQPTTDPLATTWRRLESQIDHLVTEARMAA